MNSQSNPTDRSALLVDLDNPLPSTEEELLTETGPARVMELIIEYSEKLETLASRARTILRDKELHDGREKSKDQVQSNLRRTDTWALDAHFGRLRHGIHELLRYASGLIENTRLKPIVKLELRVRVADLEGILESTEYIIQETNS